MSGGLISCIMPTRNRRHFANQAIWYFLRQDDPARELVIVDDGEDAIDDLIPNDPRIRYQRLQARTALGSKRNLGCELAQGELIAHWDDDDWISPNRLSWQRARLAESQGDVCGAAELLHYRPQTGEAWLYRDPGGSTAHLAGGTLLYRRSVWQEHRFPDVSLGEVPAFLRRIPPGRIRILRDFASYVALIHPGNTTARNLRDARWERRPLDEVSRLLDVDRAFYAGLRNQGSAQSHPAARPEVPAITVAAPFAVYEGYGSMAEYMVLGMVRAGATARLAPIGVDCDGLSAELRELLRGPRPDAEAPVLYFCWPRPELEQYRRSKDLFISTMWESSRVPADWPARLNLARAVIAPTRFVARMLRQCGVTAPVEVAPLGVDPAVYHFEERPERPGITTLIVGTYVERKHVREGIAAWKLAFAQDRDARLIIKSRFQHGNYTPDDPRIAFLDSSLKSRGIAEFYREADVLLALGNEGFGLPLVEGMASGLPAIALRSEGQGDTCEDAGDVLLPVDAIRWQEINEPPWGPCGVRGVPGVDEVAARLKWVAAHRGEARAMGRAASRWALRNRNVWRLGPAVLDIMERHARPPRPFRCVRTFWTPSWQSPCGIAEYTAHLLETLPAKATASFPHLKGVRLLHIQHENLLFDDVALARSVQQARLAGIPVVITQHAVTPQSRAWERDADALVALTAAGCAMLRSRLPGKRIEHIPHGCPTWDLPRKRSRGRVIGAFGFLERHKGYWDLLEVLRQVPGTELLLFSHAKSAGIAAEWEEAARGLKVRRYDEFLPVEDVARRLAAEADVLVFWYSAVPQASASGAVRVGLATGVPVLASPTNWFTDLRSATYQPGDLIPGVARLLEDEALRLRLTSAAREYCEQHSWARTAERHLALWRELDRR